MLKKIKVIEKYLFKSAVTKISVFIFFISIYSLFSAGQLTTLYKVGTSDKEFSTMLDENIKSALSMGMLFQHKIDFPKKLKGNSMLVQGKDGRMYSYFGIGKSIFNIPFFWIGAKISPQKVSLHKFMIYLFIPLSFENVLITAIILLILFMFLVDLGFTERVSFLLILIYGFCTIAFSNAKYPNDESLTSLFLLIAVFSAFRYKKTLSKGQIILSAVSLGCAILTRLTSIIVIPLIYWYLIKIKRGKKGKFIQDIMLYSFLVLIFILLYMYYNYARFGNVFDTGYGHRNDWFIFSPWFPIKSIIDMLISPNIGFFVYMPVFILSLLGIKDFFRKYKSEGILFLSIFIIYLVFHSFWYASNAFISGGPRFLSQVHIFLIPFLGTFITSVCYKKRLWKSLFWIFSLSGLIINLLFIVISPRRARGSGIQPKKITSDWNISESHIVFQVKSVVQAFEGKGNSKEYPEVKEFLNRPNFWWIHFKYLGVSKWKILETFVFLIFLSLLSFMLIRDNLKPS